MTMLSFQEKYQKEIIPQLMKELGLKSKLAVPRVVRLVVNMGIAADKGNKEAIERAKKSLAQITGQIPRVCRAKRSISSFSLREGNPIGLKVTLRGRRSEDFLMKFFNIVLPQVRDFRGLPPTAFDGQGNYTVGLKENTVFPEIDYDKIDRPRGLEVTIVTNTNDDKKAKRLLTLLGAPFKSKDKTNDR